MVFSSSHVPDIVDQFLVHKLFFSLTSHKLICLLILVFFNTLITSFVLLLITWLYLKWCIYLPVMVYNCCTLLVILCHIVPHKLPSTHKIYNIHIILSLSCAIVNVNFVSILIKFINKFAHSPLLGWTDLDMLLAQLYGTLQLLFSLLCVAI